jgi:dTDP-4-amino-4,6-dideoxygalactose transaminase
MLDLRAQYRSLKHELDLAVQRVLDSGCFVSGRENEAFERELADYLQVPHVVGVNSGTDALLLALKALGIGPGDEVIVPSFTFFATAEAVALAGAVPVFADCVPGAYGVSAPTLEQVRSPRTRAAIVVHLFGSPVELGPIHDWCATHGLALIEDAAQAIGARYDERPIGSFGDAAAFSFYPTKNLGAFGDGGAVACRDEAVAMRLRQLRNHGRCGRYEHHSVGHNSRLDEIQAAILRAKMPHLDDWNRRRRQLAARYRQQLQGTACRWPQESARAVPVHHQCVAMHPRRDALAAYLGEHGVDSGLFYATPCHRQPAFASVRHPQSLPACEQLADTVLALPIYPELSEEAVDRVAGLIRAFEDCTHDRGARESRATPGAHRHSVPAHSAD